MRNAKSRVRSAEYGVRNAECEIEVSQSAVFLDRERNSSGEGALSKTPRSALLDPHSAFLP